MCFDWLFGPSTPEEVANNEIEKALIEDKKTMERTIKLLLLGTTIVQRSSLVSQVSTQPLKSLISYNLLQCIIYVLYSRKTSNMVNLHNLWSFKNFHIDYKSLQGRVAQEKAPSSNS